MQKESAAYVAKFMTSSLSMTTTCGISICRGPATDTIGYFECVKQYSGLFAGATYKVNGLEGFTREIWICPVTLTVLGHYPQYIYIKQMQININND